MWISNGTNSGSRLGGAGWSSVRPPQRGGASTTGPVFRCDRREADPTTPKGRRGGRAEGKRKQRNGVAAQISLSLSCGTKENGKIIHFHTHVHYLFGGQKDNSFLTHAFVSNKTACFFFLIESCCATMFPALQVKRQIHEICRTRLTSALHNTFPRSPSGAKKKTSKQGRRLSNYAGWLTSVISLSTICYKLHLVRHLHSSHPQRETGSLKKWRKETFLHLEPPNLHNTNIILMKVQARCRVSNNSQAWQFLSMKRAHIWHLAAADKHKINSSKLWWIHSWLQLDLGQILLIWIRLEGLFPFFDQTTKKPCCWWTAVSRRRTNLYLHDLLMKMSKYGMNKVALVNSR